MEIAIQTHLLLRLMAWAIALMTLIGADPAQASPLVDRMAQFPNWTDKPPTQVAQGDLKYPAWFGGTWTVTTALVDLAAPLAPTLTTPGFEGNRQYLNQPIQFQARFLEQPLEQRKFPFFQNQSLIPKESPIVADRAFNGYNLAIAYLEATTGPFEKPPILAVKVDPQNPNRQITLLRGDRQLVSTVVARATENPAENQFVTTEVVQQEFRRNADIYFNEVETTTIYTYHPSEIPTITADQATAIYLSPQDPDFFKSRDRPVALYRYTLDFR